MQCDWMTHERIADAAACSDDDIEHTFRQSGFFEDFREQQSAGDRRIACGLEHDGVPER
jgi:hypothetical protein